MADEDSNIPTRRKLPPLRGNEASLGEAGEDQPEKKVKKKKKKVPQKSEDGTVDETEKPKPRRKKTKDAVDGEAETAEAGEDAALVKKKKKRPKSAADPTADEGTSETPRKKKTPRKSKEVTGSQGSLGNLAGEGDTEPKKPKTKKKGKKGDGSKANLQEDTRDKDFINSAFMADLDDLKEDIVKDEDTDGDEEDEDDGLAVGGHVRSQPAPTLYIEQKDRFASKNKEKLFARLEAESHEKRDDDEPEVVRDSLHTSLFTQKVIRTFSLWCHGLLAGYAFWNLIMVYILSFHSDLDFLHHYQPVGQPCQNLYYLFFIICMVSALDKYDLGHPTKRVIKRCLTLQTGAIASVVYFISMVISLSINHIDDRIWLYNINNNTLWNVTSETTTTLTTWRILNTIRASGAILGWIIISFQPLYDRLSQNLASHDNFLNANMMPV